MIQFIYDFTLPCYKMTELLESKVRKAYWGYIHLNRDEQLKHTLIQSSNGVYRLLRRVFEANKTMQIIKKSSRDNLPYLGMISWRHVQGKFRLYGLITASDISQKQCTQLHEEVVEIAKIKRVNEIITQTGISRRKMEPLGWQYNGPAKDGDNGVYVFPIDNKPYHEAVKLFNKIRDVPYVLGKGGTPDLIIEDNCGECTRKNLKLAKDLTENGHSIEILVYKFDWRDLPIPEEIKELLKRPIQHHVTVYVKDLDIELDATFPLYMQQLGFNVNNWDGETSTQVSVNPLAGGKKVNYSVFLAKYKASQIIKNVRSLVSPPKTPFNNAFNEWVSTHI